MFKCLLAAATAVGILAGCAMPAHIPLSQENAKKIQTVDVRSMVIQDEVIARADPSTVSLALGGGLIPALVDASITANRQDKLQSAMNSFYESIEDYDFRTVYWPQLTKTLREQYPLKVNDILTTPRGLGYAEEMQFPSTLPENRGQLVMATSYFLSSDLRTLNVATYVNLWLKGGTQPAYRNSMTYQSSVQGTGGEQSAKEWGRDGGKTFIDKLNEGIRETLAMLSIDMKNNEPVPATAEKVTVKYNYGTARAPDGGNLKGTVVEKHGDRIILRNDAGQLYSVQR